jgi:ketosteroid isomerase-like protein
MNNDPVATARAIYQAYGTKDRAAIEKLLADDFHFTSPLDNRIDRTTYFARCWTNSERIAGFEFINLVANGDQVFVTYEGRRPSNGGRFRNTEILSIRDGQIVNIEVYFGWPLPHPAAQGGYLQKKEE